MVNFVNRIADSVERLNSVGQNSEALISEMVSERGILEGDLEKSRAQISNLVAEVAALKNSLEENQVEMIKKEENISELNQTLRKFKDEVTDVTRSSQSWQEKYLKSTSKLTELQKHTKAQDEIQQEKVYFFSLGVFIIIYEFITDDKFITDPSLKKSRHWKL